jgi:hypothetical protein
MVLTSPNLGEITDSSRGLSEATPTETLLIPLDPDGIENWSRLNAFAKEVFDIWHPFRMLAIPSFTIRWCRRFAPQPPALISLA